MLLDNKRRRGRRGRRPPDQSAGTAGRTTATGEADRIDEAGSEPRDPTTSTDQSDATVGTGVRPGDAGTGALGTSPGDPRVKMLDYLIGLTDYLPESKKADFRSSSEQLKMDVLKSRIAASAPKNVSGESAPSPGSAPVTQESPHPSPGPAPVTRHSDAVVGTFDFLGQLAEHHPDPSLGRALKTKIGRLIDRIRNRNG